MNLKKFKEFICDAKLIYLASHINPDGDNIGSTLAMYAFLKKLGKKVHAIEDDEIPYSLKFLPFIDNFESSKNLKEKPDLFITLDSADIDRIGPSAKELFLSAKRTINIDHHITNTNYADINIVAGDLSSTGELLYNIAKEFHFEIDKDIATCIYSAISTDTGSFKYDNLTSKTLKVASELVDYGIDIGNIGVNLYQTRSLAKTRLLVEALNTLEILEDGKIGLVYIDEDMIYKCKAQSNDTEGIVEFVRDISGLELAAFFKIKKNSIKLSLRSKGYVDVAKIAKYFSGGGHIRAAGATLKLPFEKRKEEFIKIAMEQI